MTPLRKRMIEELQLRNLSPLTKEKYVSAVERFARYCHQSPERLGPEQVRRYLLHLINDHHACANTVLFHRAALRFLYVSTLKQKWFDDEIARPKRRPTLPGVLKHWTMLATFYATGLRCNELRHLKAADLDSHRMVIHVRQGKGGIDREIALSPALLERLRVYFRWRRPLEWLFPSKQRPAEPLDDGTIRTLCRNAGTRAGIGRPVFPHLFRHACATHMLDAGADLRTIQVLLGHADIRTTARYLNVSIQRLQAVRSPFDALQLKPIERSVDEGRQR